MMSAKDPEGEAPRDYQAVLQLKLSLPPTLNQSYKIVTIRGVSRLALSEEASEYKDEIAIVAFQALTKEFPVINGPGGGEYRLELVQWLPRNSRDTGFAPPCSRWPRAFGLPDRFDRRACHSMRRRSSGGGDSFLNSTRAHEASEALSGH